MNREQFEKLPKIKNRLIGMVFCYSKNQYIPKNKIIKEVVFATSEVNLAWYAYQEQQKKIDIVKDEINNFFDNQKTTPSSREYANKIADILELLK